MKIRFLLFFFFLTNTFFSQVITGIVQNDLGENINFGNLYLKEHKDSTAIKEFHAIKGGKFKFEVKSNFDRECYLIVSVNGYEKEIEKIDLSNKQKQYEFTFKLKKEDLKILKEIKIEAKRKPYTIKKDTVIFNVSAYKDTHDRKLQDVLKKMPGIEINEKSGEVKYRGKQVESIQLEGDDLFGLNYALVTKNLNIDMVEQVQAIENFSKNPLLKNIADNSDKVALNLKLKKNKIDFSGSLEGKSGLFDAAKPANKFLSTLLAITQKLKSYGIAAYNNIGENQTPFDNFSNNVNLEELKTQQLYTNKVITESQINSSLERERINENNQLFFNYNFLQKFGKNLSVKTNLFKLNDDIYSKISNNNENIINNQTIITSDASHFRNKPKLIKGEMEMKLNTSKNSLLEYRISTNLKKNFSTFNIIQNNSDETTSNISSEDTFIKNEIAFTQKINEKSALIFNLIQANNDNPQTLILTPALFDDSFTRAIQESQFSKKSLNLNANLLGKVGKKKYSIFAGVVQNKTPYQSNLRSLSSTGNTINGSRNNFIYESKNYFLSSQINFFIKEIKFSPNIKLKYLTQELEDRQTIFFEQKKNIFIEPGIDLFYKINNTSFITGYAKNLRTPPSEDYLIANPVLTSNRVFISSNPSLKNQNITFYGVNYSINDLYNQFQLSTSLNYTTTNGYFVTNFDIDKNITFIKYMFLEKEKNDVTFNLMVDKYIPFLQSTIKFNSNITHSKYYNFVNDSNIRKNSNLLINPELSIKTSFNTKINFEESFQYSHNTFYNDYTNNITNSSLKNHIKLKAKINKAFSFNIFSEFHLPNLSKKRENFHFLDASFNFIPKIKNIDFSLNMKNILNQRNFSQINNTDFSKRIFTTSLNSRLILLNLNYNF